MTITGPLHAHGVRTAEDYRAKQAAHIADLMTARPNGPWGAPHAVAAPVDGYVNGGRWLVRCPCGNTPSASPEWGVACCFECGAVYTVAFPDDRDAIESILVKRPVMRTRNWIPGETVADLDAENVAHGVAS